jgi:hypothetical protein
VQNQPGLLGFLDTKEPADLGPRRRQGVRSQEDLASELDSVLRASNLSADRANAIRALILLWHDHMDAAHEIAQQLDTAEGAFIHGIVHRREPDFGNAAYWFRRVGNHPAFARIAQGVDALLKHRAAGAWSPRLIPNQQWDPFKFISACQEASQPTSGEAQLLREAQRVEFEELLGWLAARPNPIG